jgi:hypothetical protein
LACLAPWSERDPEDREYAIERIVAIAENFQGLKDEIENAPTVAVTREYLRWVEKTARELEAGLGMINRWATRPLFDVLGGGSKRFDEDSLYLNAHGEDFTPPWELEPEKGCPGWQSRLDALSRWAGKAAENLEGTSRGGPLNMASLHFGNPKEMLVLDCLKLTSDVCIHWGLSKDGPLLRFSNAVHKFATGEEGTGFVDVIRAVADWRKSFGSAYWNEYWTIENERTLLRSRLGLHPAAPLPDIPEAQALSRRQETLDQAEHGITEGPHKLREYRKAHGGGNPTIPCGDTPVAPKE